MDILVYTQFGETIIKNPEDEELAQLIELLREENLDLRRLAITAQDSYPSQGNNVTSLKWRKQIKVLEDLNNTGKISNAIFQAIKLQSKGILAYKPIPEKGTKITDPFNMARVEQSTNPQQLRDSQIKNILILKLNEEIISSARVLPVEGSWEIVSIVTRPTYRRKGLASLLIKNIFALYPQRPLFSFQQLNLVPYYLREYEDEKPTIPPFEELPKALQRDLFYMNVIWEPNIIIKICGKSYNRLE